MSSNQVTTSERGLLPPEPWLSGEERSSSDDSATASLVRLVLEGGSTQGVVAPRDGSVAPQKVELPAALLLTTATLPAPEVATHLVAIDKLPAAAYPIAGRTAPRGSQVGDSARAEIGDPAVGAKVVDRQASLQRIAVTASPVTPAPASTEAGWQTFDRQGGKDLAVDAQSASMLLRQAEPMVAATPVWQPQGAQAAQQRAQRRDRKRDQHHGGTEEGDHQARSDEDEKEAQSHKDAVARANVTFDFAGTDDELRPSDGLVTALRAIASREEVVAHALAELDEGRVLVFVAPFAAPLGLRMSVQVAVLSASSTRRGQHAWLHGEMVLRDPLSAGAFTLACFSVSRASRWRWSVQAVADATGIEPIALALGTRAPCGLGSALLLRIPDSNSFLDALGAQRTVRLLVATQPVRPDGWRSISGRAVC